MRIYCIIALLVLSTVAIKAQVAPFSKEDGETFAQIKLLELQAPNCRPDRCAASIDELAALYAKAARSPNLLRYLASKAVLGYETARPEIRSAPQASQIADEQNAALMRLIVLQNQRIIELLDIIAKKR